jgi:hypothetical protein
MRCVRTAVLARNVDSLYASRALQGLFDADPRLFQKPLLYLTAHTSNPIVTEPLFSGEMRSDAILLYYVAANKLLARCFAEADADLVHAWELSAAAKDMRPSIIQAMSLTAFLTGQPWELFSARLPAKYLPPTSPTRKLWRLDGPLPTPLPRLYERFSYEITREHARRVILDTARVATRVPLGVLTKWCGDPQIQGIVPPGEVTVRVEGNVVHLGEPSLAPIVEAHIAALAKRLSPRQGV